MCTAYTRHVQDNPLSAPPSYLIFVVCAEMAMVKMNSNKLYFENTMQSL